MKHIITTALFVLFCSCANAQSIGVGGTISTNNLPNANTPLTSSDTVIINQLDGGVIRTRKANFFAAIRGYFVANPFSGDCSTSAVSSSLICTKTNGTSFGPLATLTPGTGVASALAIATGASGGFPVLGTGGYLAAANFPALTGDITTTAGALGTTLATVNSNVGSFGSSTQVGTFTVNAKGLLTAAANVTVTPAVGSITGLGTGVASALAVATGAAGGFPVLATGGYLAAAQEPAHTGDVTNSAGSLALTLATVNSNVGSFGSSTQSPVVTVNGKGLVTAVSNTTITPAIGSVTGLGTGVATALANAVNSANGVATLNASNFLGVGISSPNARVVASGAGQTTGNYVTSSSMPDAMMIDDTGVTAGNGGALVFSAASQVWKFAAIKGYVTNGGGNSQGDITFSVRRSQADAALTESMRLKSAGVLQINALTAGLVQSDASGNLSQLATGTGVTTAIGNAVNGANGFVVTSNAQAGDNVVMGTAGGTPAYTAITNCAVAVTYSTTTHSWGCNTSAGAGTVTSVAQTVPSEMSISGSPITTSGTLAISWASSTAGKFIATPSSGSGAYAGRAITCADLPAGGRCLVATYSPSAAASAGDANIFASAGYSHYDVELVNLASSVNGNTMELQFSTDGSTFQTSSYEYAGITNNSGGSANEGSGSAAFILLSRSGNFNGNDAASCGMGGYFKITKRATATTNEKPKIVGHMTGCDSSVGGQPVYNYSFSGSYNNGSSAAITGFKVFPSSGNITGTVNVYGYN